MHIGLCDAMRPISSIFTFLPRLSYGKPANKQSEFKNHTWHHFHAKGTYFECNSLWRFDCFFILFFEIFTFRDECWVPSINPITFGAFIFVTIWQKYNSICLIRNICLSHYLCRFNCCGYFAVVYSTLTLWNCSGILQISISLTIDQKRTCLEANSVNEFCEFNITYLKMILFNKIDFE